jgi:hypothetical protein
VAPCVQYWWAVLAGTVSVPLVGGALWKQLSLAHARWRSTHAGSDRDRVCAFEVLRLENPSAPLIPSYVQSLLDSLSPQLLGHASAPEASTLSTLVRILGPVSNPVPDARHAGAGIGWKERRYGPRHASVWVRIVW